MTASASICRHFSAVIHSCCPTITYLIPHLFIPTRRRNTHSHNNSPFAIMSIIAAFTQSWQNARRVWNPELQWPGVYLKPWNGGKNFIRLLSCGSPVFVIPHVWTCSAYKYFGLNGSSRQKVQIVYVQVFKLIFQFIFYDIYFLISILEYRSKFIYWYEFKKKNRKKPKTVHPRWCC